VKKKMEEFRKKREEEEEGNILKAIEHKAFDSKREMEIADALDEIRSLNARQSKIDPLDLLEHITPQKNHQDNFEFDLDELKLIEDMEEKENEITKRLYYFDQDTNKSTPQPQNNQENFKEPLPRLPFPKRTQSSEPLVILPGFKNLRLKK